MIEITFIGVATIILSALSFLSLQIEAHFRCLDMEKARNAYFRCLDMEKASNAHFRCLDMEKARNAHFCYMIFIILLSLLINVMGVIYGCFNIKIVYILIGYSVIVFFDLCIVAMKLFSPLQRFLYFSVSVIVFFIGIELLFGRLYIEFAHNLPVIKTDAELEEIYSFLYYCFLEGFKDCRFPSDVFSIGNLPCLQALVAFFMVYVVPIIFAQLFLDLLNPVTENSSHQ